jgi:hypothetical protein
VDLYGDGVTGLGTSVVLNAKHEPSLEVCSNLAYQRGRTAVGRRGIVAGNAVVAAMERGLPGLGGLLPRG